MSVYWMTWGLGRAMAPVIGGFLNDKISPHAVWYGGLIIGLSSTLGLFLLGRSRALSAAGNLAAPQTT
jgi:MFS family permease